MIIYGSKTSPTTVNRGTFHCPVCRGSQPYHLERIRKYFTLYFIPLFPTETIAEFVECQRCRGTFHVDVLEYDPAVENHRIRAQFEIAILHTLSMMLLADGMVEASEVEAIGNIYRSVTGQEVTPEDIQASLSEIQGNPGSPLVFLEELAPHLNEHGKELVVKAAICLAAADGSFADEEVATLNELAGALQMSPAHFKGIIDAMTAPEPAAAGG